MTTSEGEHQGAESVRAKRSRTVLRGIILGTGLALGVAGVYLHGQEVTLAPSLGPSAAEPIAVGILRAESRDFGRTIRLTGVLRASESVTLSAEVNGRILRTGPRELEWARRGQLLVEIDPEPYRAALQRAQAELEEAESAAALAASELRRRKSLAEAGVVSEAVLEATESANRSALAAGQRGRAAVRDARHRLSRTRLEAPFDGFLRLFSVEAEEFLRDGQQIGEIVDLSRVRLRVGVADHEIVGIRLDQPVRIDVSARPGESWTGSIARLAPAADPGTKKFPVEIELPNDDLRLHPGMVASATIEIAAARSWLALPQAVVGREAGQAFVWTVVEDPETKRLVARKRAIRVEPIPHHPTWLSVENGLQARVRVVSTPRHRLSEGTWITVENGSTAAVASP